MSLLSPLKRYYGHVHLGTPFGINFRRLLETLDFHLTRYLRFFSTFSFNGKRYRYFHHRYNQAHANERTVEIPLVRPLLDRYRPENVLEVGNVLRHYGHSGHTVVDKYEPYPDVINVDIVNFKPQRRYHLIVSISTLEHVGWDETPKQPKKCLQAIAHLKTLLEPGGLFVFTAPLGYHPQLDAMVKNRRLPMQTLDFLCRLDQNNTWHQCTRQQALTHRYNSPYPFANAILIATFIK